MKTTKKGLIVFAIFTISITNIANLKMNSESSMTLFGIERAFATGENGSGENCYTQVTDVDNYIDGCRHSYYDCWSGSSSSSCTKGYQISCPGEDFISNLDILTC